jgi:hypothetical protein
MLFSNCKQGVLWFSLLSMVLNSPAWAQFRGQGFFGGNGRPFGQGAGQGNNQGQFQPNNRFQAQPAQRPFQQLMQAQGNRQQAFQNPLQQNNQALPFKGLTQRQGPQPFKMPGTKDPQQGVRRPQLPLQNPKIGQRLPGQGGQNGGGKPLQTGRPGMNQRPLNKKPISKAMEQRKDKIADKLPLGGKQPQRPMFTDKRKQAGKGVDPFLANRRPLANPKPIRRSTDLKKFGIDLKPGQKQDQQRLGPQRPNNVAGRFNLLNQNRRPNGPKLAKGIENKMEGILNGAIRAWDLASDADKFKAIGEFKGSNRITIDLNQDGWLVVSDRDSVQIYDSELKFYREDVWSHRHAKWRPGSRQVLRSSEVMSLWEPNAAPEDDKFIHSEEVFDSIDAAPWCWSPDGDRCINADNFYMLDSSLTRHQPPLTGVTKGIVEPYWSPDGRMFITSHDADEYALRIWQADGKQLMAWHGPSFDVYHAERFSWHPDSSELLVADSKRLYSLNIAQRSVTDFKIEKKQIASATWSRDEQFALAGMLDGSMHVFKRSGVPLKTLSRGSESLLTVETLKRSARWEPFGLWKKLSVPDADGTPARETWTRTWVGPSWQPGGKQLLLGGTEVTALDEEGLQNLWHAVALPGGWAVTFSAAGELLDGDPDDVDPYLIYYVQRDDGPIETLTPAEFRQLSAALAH